MITGSVVEMLARNTKFAQAYKAPPGLMQMASTMKASGAGVVVVSCSDPRLNPYQILGIDQTLKATMVRNAGGRVFDALRTLAVLQTIGSPGTIVVMHHTDCGVTHYHDSKIREALSELAPKDKAAIEATKFGEIKGSIEESVIEDLEILRASPWIKKSTQLIGLKYDIDTGKLEVVGEEQAQL
ncbi:hypothetical protein LTR91_005702 [Friedmanniomyces endolithicus]|uniref:Carbonic anhydrase n=1 Tax=Friedmanniomyces endolithicus TaxID=329885 RepID=A0AAN6KS77_9PEZI|nr:hypothetical protein LTR35_011439 [Friedmanniomyces endolithicus]KAK0288454.1 hypothetical protein LTS00_009665 [Friedmanniomyces endolithicus]KAK0307893.1 hypothetical protein LTR01_005225 [Friedmanniomyces endolithicus]KAK0317822.1 hypothetical protein LTR82_011083 [Friedmanniomyces endolithicus]KAK0831752.1 hypothetical protein LTR73_003135 [Friedmanniomyces endolithicus]